MKIELDKRKKHRHGLPWKSAMPFVENRMAILVHRPRFVTTHKISEKYDPHIAIEYWCGSTQTGTDKFTFLDSPPDGKLLCARCEEKAVSKGQKSSFQLVGKHVHTGRCVAVQECCKNLG